MQYTWTHAVYFSPLLTFDLLIVLNIIIARDTLYYSDSRRGGSRGVHREQVHPPLKKLCRNIEVL